MAHIEQHQTAAVLLELFEFLPSLVDLFPNRRVGIERTEAFQWLIRRIEVFHIEYDWAIFPFDGVVRFLALPQMALLKLEGNLLEVEILLKGYLTVRSRCFRHGFSLREKPPRFLR